MATVFETLLRHAEHHARWLGELGERQIAGENVLPELDMDWDQLLAAHSWALDAAAEDERAARVVSDMADPGLLLSYRLHPQERIEWLMSAREAADRLGDRVATLQHYRGIGRAYMDLGDHARAGEHHARALSIALEAELDVVAAEEYDYLGVCLRARGELESARKMHEEALKIFRRIENRDGEGVALSHLGQNYWRHDDTEGARECFESAHRILSEVSPQKAPQALGHLAGVIAQQGDCERALDLARESVELARRFADPRSEARLLIGLGGVERMCGRGAEARLSFESARRVAVEHADDGAEEWALEWIAKVDRDLGELESSLGAYSERVALARARRDTRAEHAALVELGDAYAGAGMPRDAFEIFRRARDLAAFRLTTANQDDPFNIDANALRLDQARARERLGDLAAEAEALDAAVAEYRAAVDLLVEHPQRAPLQGLLAKFGYALADSGEHDEAIECHRRRIEIVRGLGDRAAEADATGEIANVLMMKGAFEDSLDHFRRALAIDREIGNREDELAVANNMAEPLRSLGRWDEAIASLERALALARELRRPDHEGLVGMRLAQTWQMAGSPDRAVEAGEQAHAALVRAGSPLADVAERDLQGWRAAAGLS